MKQIRVVILVLVALLVVSCGGAAEVTFPDFQEILEEDISGMGIGHLNKGLLWAQSLV